MRLVMNYGHSRIVYGRLIKAGEEFEVPDNEARTWKLMGWASEAPEQSKRGRPRKEYNRRDMRAEDE